MGSASSQLVVEAWPSSDECAPRPERVSSYAPEEASTWAPSRGASRGASSREALSADGLVGLLRATRRLGHDDLIDPEHGDGGLGRCKDGLLLCEQQVQDGRLCDDALDNVDAGALLARLVRRVHPGDDARGVEARVLRERARHDLHRERELVDRVLVESRLRLGVLLQVVGQVEFGGTRPGQEPRVLGHRLDHVDPVVDRALDVVHDVHRRAAHDDRRHVRLVVPLLVEDRAPGGG